jgi:ATP-binding cassette subfamily B multidrug efflux pump
VTPAAQTLLRYIVRRRRQLSLATVTVIVSSALAVVPPLIIREVFDRLAAGTTMQTILVLAMLVVVVSIAENLARMGSRWLVMNASRRTEYELRNDLFAHLQTLHVGFFQHSKIGDLMARMTNDVQAVRMMLGPGVLNVFQTGVLLLLALAFMFSISVKLTLAALVLLPMVSIAFWFIGRRVHVRFERLQSQFSDLAATAQENFSGIRVVKAYGQEDAEIEKFGRVNREYVSRAIELAATNGLIWPSMSLILGAATLATLYLGGWDVIRGELTLGQLVQFIAYLATLAWPMVALGWVSNLFQQGAASLKRLQELFDARPAIADPIDPVTAPIRGDVEFDGAWFAYGSSIVLRDISFRVPAGKTLAIVGPTGAGKSTLVSLVARLYDVQQGAVRIDGVDVRRYPLQHLRRAIASVPQETFLFSVPLRENIGFGLEQISDEALAWAGDVSQLSNDVADFPARYDTVIGERGVTLSGGQKQRAAIARAVVRDPRILILDDALSSVDTYTEAEILRRLRGIMQTRTTIIVSHRISTVKDADEIIVLDEGRIVERGTHQTLLAAAGLYADMYRRQLLEEELEVDVEGEGHRRRLRAERLREYGLRRPGLPEMDG